jgi:nitrite reductase (NADH) large subunit
MRRKDLVVIGSGNAATHLLDALVARGASERFSITVFGDEPGPGYARHLLDLVLRGGAPADLALKPESWYAQHRITLRHAEVQRLDTALRRTVDARGGLTHYDVAVLATGSVPKLPSIPGIHDDTGALRAGVHVLRTIADASAVRARVRPGARAVVLGGGLLGVETARTLTDLGLHVTLVHLGHGLLDRQLDFVGGQLLGQRLEASGLEVRTGRTIDTALGTGVLTGVQLDDGERLAAELLVIACGVRPRVDVAHASGIPINHGVLVNDALATQVPGVYALGDCAEHKGKTHGMLAPAREQADVLADVLSGHNIRARYRGSRPIARAVSPGLDVVSLGEVEPQREGDRVLQVVEERLHQYRKLIVRQGQLVGAALVGDTRAEAALRAHYERGEPLPADPLDLLRSPEAPSVPSAPSPVSDVQALCGCAPDVRELIRSALALGASTLLLEQAEASGNLCPACSIELSRERGAHLRAVPA